MKHASCTTADRGLAWLVCLLACTSILVAVPVRGEAQLPRPADVFGFEPGADYRLATAGQIETYFRRLAASSDRVAFEEIGTSTQGRSLYIALISSPENLRNRDRYREISRRLAVARGLSDEEARALAREGKAIVWLNGGQHADEVAHAQHRPEFAHWLAADEGSEARQIRAEAIVLVMPVLNPDGLDIVAGWYERVLGTPYETSPPPVLWHEYVGHDINRDWNAFTQEENRAVARILYREWFPQIVQDHHQWGPFPGRIWVPPAAGPINPHVDPIAITSSTHIGQYLKKRFASEGKSGVTSGGWYRSLWSGAFLSGSAKLRNLVGMFTETALYEYATPHCYEPWEIGDTFTDQLGIPLVSTREPGVKYPDPWRGGCWHLRDAVEYMLTASRGIAYLGATLKEEYLLNGYVMGTRQIARGEEMRDSPYAYVIDLEDQHDPGSAVELLRTFQRVWPAGTVLVRRTDRATLTALAQELGLMVHGIDSPPDGPLEELRLPRIGVYRSHVASIREGWLRWFLTSREIPFESLHDADVRQGDLARFDIVVLADQAPAEIRSGHPAGTMPAEYVGGLGAEGVGTLRRFVEEGGWVLAYGQTVELAAAAFDLPFQSVRIIRTSGSGPEGHRIPQRIPFDDFLVDGALIRLHPDVSSRLGYGMRESAAATVRRTDAIFDLIPFAEARSPLAGAVEIHARYAARDYLLSGWETGGDRYLAGRPAAASTAVGRGRVVLIGFDPIFRGQPHNTFKLLFNPLFASSAVCHGCQ